MSWSDRTLTALPPASTAEEARMLEELSTIAPDFSYASNATTKGVAKDKRLQQFLSQHVRTGPYVWQYRKNPPPPLPSAVEDSRTRDLTAPAPFNVRSDVNQPPCASYGVPIPPHWLPGPIPWDLASAALQAQHPDAGESTAIARR